MTGGSDDRRCAAHEAAILRAPLQEHEVIRATRLLRFGGSVVSSGHADGFPFVLVNACSEPAGAILASAVWSPDDLRTLMSYAIDLGIDCGPSEEVADQMARHFDHFKIRLPACHDVECDAAGKAMRSGHWFVGIYPRGMGYGVKDCRPELVEEGNYERIEQALYDHLSLVSGYHRAWFAQEAFDFFTSPTPEELAIIDFPDMIYSTAVFPVPLPGRRTDDFSPGYLRVNKD